MFDRLIDNHKQSERHTWIEIKNTRQKRYASKWKENIIRIKASSFTQGEEGGNKFQLSQLVMMNKWQFCQR